MIFYKPLSNQCRIFLLKVSSYLACPSGDCLLLTRSILYQSLIEFSPSVMALLSIQPIKPSPFFNLLHHSRHHSVSVTLSSYRWLFATHPLLPLPLLAVIFRVMPNPLHSCSVPMAITFIAWDIQHSFIILVKSFLKDFICGSSKPISRQLLNLVNF